MMYIKKYKLLSIFFKQISNWVTNIGKICEIHWKEQNI